MMWPAMLITISGYGWYLIVAYAISGTPDLMAGILGLFIVGILPTCLGFLVNQRFGTSNTTALAVTLQNVLSYLFYGLCTVAFSFTGLFVLTPLVLVWQLISWVLGTYLLYKDRFATTTALNIKVTEAGLGIYVAAIFLLYFMEFAAMLLLVITACWFAAFSLTLALGGSEGDKVAAVRHDIIIFHAAVPLAAAVALYFTLFSTQAYNLMQLAQRTVVTSIMYIVNLLSRAMGRSGQPDFETPQNDIMGYVPDSALGLGGRLPAWVIWPMVALTVILLVLATIALLRMLLTRFRFVAIDKGNRKTATVSGTTWHWFKQLIARFLSSVLRICKSIRVLLSRINKRIIALLPAKTPQQQMLRSYVALLRYGKKAGYPRQTYETPWEYTMRLHKAVEGKPFPHEEIAELTKLFLEARYSDKPVNWQQAQASKRLIKKIYLQKV